MGAAGHQVITGTFGRGAGQDRGFHIQEAIVVQIAADAAGDARAQLQLGGHFRATQVDEAIAQAGLLANVGILVQRERWRLSLVQHFQLVAQHFDGAGSHVRVDRASRPRTHFTAHLHHVFAAHAVSQGEGIFAIRIEHHLGQTFAIANIEKDHPTMVTAAVNPTAECHFLVRQCFVQLAAIVGTHHESGILLSTDRLRPGQAHWPIRQRG